MNRVPRNKNKPESLKSYNIRLDKAEYGTDIVHDACVHILKQQKKFDKWLQSDNDAIIANCLLILIARVINMLNHQMESQGTAFKNEGGFRENLTRVKGESKAKQEGAPECHECGRLKLAAVKIPANISGVALATLNARVPGK